MTPILTISLSSSFPPTPAISSDLIFVYTFKIHAGKWCFLRTQKLKCDTFVRNTNVMWIYVNVNMNTHEQKLFYHCFSFVSFTEINVNANSSNKTDIGPLNVIQFTSLIVIDAISFFFICFIQYTWNVCQQICSELTQLERGNGFL